MMKNKVITALLLVFTLTAAADNEHHMLRPCRAAVPPEYATNPAISRRAPGDHFIGDRRQLVVITEFNDLKFSEESPLTTWNKIFNTKRLSEEPFYGSVHDYFYDQSYGKMNLQFDLLHISLDEPHATYRSVGISDEGCTILVKDIVDALDGVVTDWSPYDWDGDGYVDQMLVIFAGKGQNSGGDSNTIWANQCWMTAYDKEPLKVPSANGDLLLDCYCCTPELSSSNDYGSFGTLCHEFSHCLGFPDFYNGSKSYVGNWDIMDSGNYNFNGFCPTAYSIHERMYLGWVEPQELTETTDISGMQPTEVSPESYLIRNDADPNDFYIVENRQQQGWDEGLPGHGLVVFHVIYDEEVWRIGVPNTSSIQRYTIVPANNKSSFYYSKNWSYPYELRDSLTATSMPASAFEGKSLLHISFDGQLASFTYRQKNPTGIEEIEDSRWAADNAVYDLQGRRIDVSSSKSQIPNTKKGICIVRNKNGEVRKVTSGSMRQLFNR